MLGYQFTDISTAKEDTRKNLTFGMLNSAVAFIFLNLRPSNVLIMLM